MANSSDWIAQVDRQADAVASNGWIAALTLDAAQSGGFRDISPFAPPGAQPPAPSLDEGSENEDAQAQDYHRGFADGQAKASHAAEQALAESRERFKQLRLGFQTLDTCARDALAGDLNATVLALCMQVLGDYALDHDALIARCHAAAARLGSGPAALTLTLHPETRALLNDSTLADWTITEDTTLLPGALRLTGPDGSVREGPDDWSRAIAQALGS